MKTNEPVTQNEITFSNESILVTKTDLKGFITYCNKEFIDISGFSEDELIGSNHNIVRHPDMPPAAYEDLWETVKAGKPWTGMVKNRAKSGDFYWVKASVTPIVQGGRIVEYMSVRTRPSQSDVEEAESFYRKVRSAETSYKTDSLRSKANIFQNIKVTHKFLSIVLAMLLPIVVMTWMLFDNYTSQISFSEKERDGVEYIQPLRQLLEHFAQHRGLNNALKNGGNVQAKVDAVRAKLETDIANVVAVHARLGEALKVDKEWSELKSKWTQLKAETSSLFAPESFARHTALIAELQALIVKVADYSNLILDPDLDTYYLMDATVMRFPVVLENMGILRGKGSGYIGKGVIDEKQWLDATIRANRISDFAKSSLSAIQTSFDNNESLSPVMQDAFDEFKQASEKFQSTAQKLLDNHLDLSGMDSAAFFAEGTQSISAGYALYDLALQNLDMLLAQRVEKMQTAMTIKFVMVFIVLTLVALMTWLNVTAIVNPLNSLLERVQKIASGDFDISATKANADEIGKAINAVDIMSIRLGFDIADAKDKATKAIRIKLALDNNSTPTTVSDDTNTLIYMNAAAETQFRSMQSAWQKTYRGFDVDDLVGNSLSEYLPEGELKDAYRAVLKSQVELDGVIAERNIHLITNPIYDEEKNYVGRVTQWIDQTEMLAEAEREKLRIEEERRVASENERIKVALDNVSSNVILADPDLEIIYMNKEACHLFNEVENDVRSDLPAFNGSDLLGSQVSDIHPNPVDQRALLNALMARHEDEFDIGGRTFKLIANPVIDATGQKLGTALEWTDRTLEVATEQEIDALVESAGRGDLSQRLDTENKNGFFLELSNRFNRLLDQLNHVFQDVENVMSHMAKGDLSIKIESEYDGVYGEVKSNVNQTIENIDSTVSSLRKISENVGVTAGELSQGNNNLSSRTEQQASNLQEIAATMEEFTRTISQNSDSAQQANRMTSVAVGDAEKGGEIVTDAIGAMDKISQSSAKITEIIGVIDDIAFQTNLLALNASVEAARAGEQGRGFAVVATEVRNLASRSAEAAKEIKELIKDSSDKVAVGSELVNQTGQSLGGIIGGVQKIGHIIAEIANASAEQSTAIGQVNAAITDLDNMTQQNAALAEQTSAASANMMSNAKDMNVAVDFFTISNRST